MSIADPLDHPSRRQALLTGMALSLPLIGSNPAAAATRKPVTLLNASYDPTRELYKDINAGLASRRGR